MQKPPLYTSYKRLSTMWSLCLMLSINVCKKGCKTNKLFFTLCSLMGVHEFTIVNYLYHIYKRNKFMFIMIHSSFKINCQLNLFCSIIKDKHFILLFQTLFKTAYFQFPFILGQPWTSFITNFISCVCCLYYTKANCNIILLKLFTTKISWRLFHLVALSLLIYPVFKNICFPGRLVGSVG